MQRISEVFSTQSKTELPNAPSPSINKTSACVNSFFRNATTLFTTEKNENLGPAASASKSTEIRKSVQEIVQMDEEITSLKANNASSMALEPFIQKRAQALGKLTDLVSRAKPNDLANACTQLPKENLKSAMAALKEAKADISSILLLLLREQKFPEYKELVNNTFGFNVPQPIVNAERKVLTNEIGKHDYKKVATILDFTLSIPKTSKMSKKEVETLSKGMIQQTINGKLGDVNNCFQLTGEFEKIKNPNQARLTIFCETAKDLLLTGDKTKYERLEKSVLESSAPKEIKDQFLSAAKKLTEKQALDALKTNLKTGNMDMVRAILPHHISAAMGLYVELSGQGEIEQCAQLLSLARERNMNITSLLHLRNTSKKAKQTNELAIAHDKQLNRTLSPTSRQNLIHNKNFSSEDLVRTLRDLDPLEMVSLARREGAARVVQTVFERSPQNMKAKLLRFMGKWENNTQLLKELALSGNEALCKLAIDSYLPFQDKQVLLQMRADILRARPQNYEQAASLLARLALDYP